MWKLECTRYPFEPKPTKSERRADVSSMRKSVLARFYREVKKEREREREVVAKVESRRPKARQKSSFPA